MGNKKLQYSPTVQDDIYEAGKTIHSPPKSTTSLKNLKGGIHVDIAYQWMGHRFRPPKSSECLKSLLTLFDESGKEEYSSPEVEQLTLSGLEPGPRRVDVTYNGSLFVSLRTHIQSGSTTLLGVDLKRIPVGLRLSFPPGQCPPPSSLLQLQVHQSGESSRNLDEGRPVEANAEIITAISYLDWCTGASDGGCFGLRIVAPGNCTVSELAPIEVVPFALVSITIPSIRKAWAPQPAVPSPSPAAAAPGLPSTTTTTTAIAPANGSYHPPSGNIEGTVVATRPEYRGSISNVNVKTTASLDLPFVEPRPRDSIGGTGRQLVKPTVALADSLPGALRDVTGGLEETDVERFGVEE